MGHIRLGLIGDKIQSSRSPDLHRLAGRLLGVDVSYELLIPPQRGLRFDEIFDMCRDGGFRGINVTYPYKETVLGRLAGVDAWLAALGACNTVIFEPDGPRGANTDCTGFASAFRARFGDAGPGIVAMAGAGGVGKAIAFALLALGAAEVRICDADAGKAAALASSLRCHAASSRIAVHDDVLDAARGADGIVNATPLGMAGIGGNAIPPGALTGARWAFDAVYTPEWTEFLTQAQSRGLDVLTGYELFLFQGIDAFRIFTGLDVDVPALRLALAQAALKETA